MLIISINSAGGSAKETILMSVIFGMLFKAPLMYWKVLNGQLRLLGARLRVCRCFAAAPPQGGECMEHVVGQKASGKV